MNARLPALLLLAAAICWLAWQRLDEREQKKRRHAYAAATQPAAAPQQQLDEATRALQNLHNEAVAGNRQAQFELAECFARGIGVRANETQARKWYARAAALGHEGAQRALDTPRDRTSQDAPPQG